MSKKKLLLTLSIFFTVLTFVGIGYIHLNNGEVSAGYAVIPMIAQLGFVSSYRKCK